VPSRSTSRRWFCGLKTVWAHYETGLSLYDQQLIAAGEKPPAPETIIVNGGGPKHSPAVKAEYAKARKHDPFQLKAYQGDDREVINGFLALLRKGMPVWKKIARNDGGTVEDEELAQLASACQEANNHELAITARQILVARRGRYDAADHPFITTSLRKLAPGDQIEQVLARLSGTKLNLRELVAPEK
jgi:hypothetical protein